MVELYHQLKEENGTVKTFPDGRPYMDQPTKLLRAFRELLKYELANKGS